MVDFIKANIHFINEKGAFYGSEYERKGLEDIFSDFSDYDKKSNLNVGQKISVIGDGTLHEIVSISLRLKHLSICEEPNNENSPAEIEIWVKVKSIE